MMTCDEFKERAAAYALIALDEDERRACSHHLASGAPHRGCVEAVEQASLVAARLGTALAPSLPPPRVWQNIAAEVRAHRSTVSLATSAAVTSLEEARRRGFYQICGWLVAVALLGLYLYAFPFDFRRRQPGGLGASGEPETAQRGAGLGPAGQLSPSHP
jgi:anti-sigma-K factor RskA